MILYIMPNYFCNRKCVYCYLGDLRNDQTILNLKKLQEQLVQLKEKYQIEEISIYGGEISLLPFEYISKLIDICQGDFPTNIITNYSNKDFNHFIKNYNVFLSTTINEEREKNNLIEDQILKYYNKDLSLIQVVMPSLLKKSPLEILQHLNQFKLNVGFIQYSPAIHAQINYNISNREYSLFLKNIIREYYQGYYDFQISNIFDLDNVINNNYNSLMNAVLFINPHNEYCMVEYRNGLEYFQSFKILEDWESECKNELIPNECFLCQYHSHCYAEHIKLWDKNDECCGLKSLIEWYKKERDHMKNDRKNLY